MAFVWHKESWSIAEDNTEVAAVLSSHQEHGGKNQP
jgi:hypothetical protein